MLPFDLPLGDGGKLSQHCSSANPNVVLYHVCDVAGRWYDGETADNPPVSLRGVAGVAPPGVLGKSSAVNGMDIMEESEVLQASESSGSAELGCCWDSAKGTSSAKLEGLLGPMAQWSLRQVQALLTNQEACRP